MAKAKPVLVKNSGCLIHPDELLDWVAQETQDLDLDQNGKVSAAEFEKRRPLKSLVDELYVCQPDITRFTLKEFNRITESSRQVLSDGMAYYYHPEKKSGLQTIQQNTPLQFSDELSDIRLQALQAYRDPQGSGLTRWVVEREAKVKGWDDKTKLEALALIDERQKSWLDFYNKRKSSSDLEKLAFIEKKFNNEYYLQTRLNIGELENRIKKNENNKNENKDKDYTQAYFET